MFLPIKQNKSSDPIPICHAGISPEMALRLSIAFDTSPESWLHQQMQYDLWQAKKAKKQLRVKKLCAA
jgi:addiction module HigA family antidote